MSYPKTREVYKTTAARTGTTPPPSREACPQAGAARARRNDLALKVPLQVTGLMPPGKPDGNGRDTPERKISSLPEIGMVVIQVLVAALNVVVAHVALGLKVITALGTVAENALEVIVESQKLTVAPLAGIPLTVKLALNQMESPAGIGVPLKFD